MTKKLEEEFNLPSIEDALATDEVEKFDVQPKPEMFEIAEVEKALSNAEKIDHALRNVEGLGDHNIDMDSIAQQATDSFQQLMNLGMNVSDRDAGSIFDSASKMLNTALTAKDSKINSKLKQIDMMIKKARLDNNAGTGSSSDSSPEQTFDRNELLKIINNKD
jgi:nitrogen regulatory protein PII